MNKDLPTGLYDRLVTAGLKRSLESFNREQLSLVGADDGDAYVSMTEHLRRLIERILRSVPEEDRLKKQTELCNSLISWMDESSKQVSSRDEILSVPVETLREIKGFERGEAFSEPVRQPLVPLSSLDLLVNARGEPSVGVAIENEIYSADRIDLLCAFVRWNGIRLVQRALEAHRAAGRPLRVITTVYTGSTERRALDWLVSIGAEVKVSYDTKTTRLHAKAWFFERLSGFSTAYIGSSNLTHSAMLDGLEWNVRFAQAATPELIDKFKGTFESYWASPDFEPYDPARDAERFDDAVRRTPIDEPPSTFSFDLQPWPFQLEMLQRLQAERTRHGRYRNLVVAATGTGKTLVAAFDYRELRKQLQDPTLLFVAHRREILKQSLDAYRHVLRDGSFGEMFVDGHRPDRARHVFASVQSLAQVPLDEINPTAFDVVVVDEFHHAAAPTYERLLEHLQPKILLGLTATPERTDGESVLHWFDDRIAVELRLWDALERGLLCPFQYFGVHDGTDLSQVQWSRRGYDVAALENVYTADHHRVSLIFKVISEKIAEPMRMSALGFCVSVAHARFMAAEFQRRGIPSVAVSADTSSDDREAALRDLKNGKICVIFCVDLFNEGVDVPEVDTVLFLRPTESSLIFLQQLGRGLRRNEAKSCLTVLDFIGGANRRFRFDLRFRALVGGHRSDLIREINEGFPRLPSGCAIQLDRVAQKIVLDNIKASLGSTFRTLVAELRTMADAFRNDGRDPMEITLGYFVRSAAIELDDLYRSNGWSWSRLRREAGILTTRPDPDEVKLSRAIPRLLHSDDPNRLLLYKRAISGQLKPEDLDPDSDAGRALLGLHFSLWGTEVSISSIDESLARLRQNRAISAELIELLDLLEDDANHLPEPLDNHMQWQHGIPLAVHARASLDEILTAFGRMTFDSRYRTREGVVFDKATNADLLFITLEKAESHYSPTTMYRDYSVSDELFHWESQSITSVQSPTGQRYINHKSRGSHVILFVRHRKTEAGRTSAYTCLGAADYVSHQGSNPIAITWRLRKPMPEDFYLEAKLAVA